MDGTKPITLEKAMEIADYARALTKPESASDYGASISLKIELLPFLAVLAAEVKRLRKEIEKLHGSK
jgi:hypothetical protein